MIRDRFRDRKMVFTGEYRRSMKRSSPPLKIRCSGMMTN